MKVLDNKEDFIMKLKDTGLTVQDIKDKVNKYMIETYERFDFLAETAEGMYIYDENGTPYLDFYAGIAVNNAGNRNPKVVQSEAYWQPLRYCRNLQWLQSYGRSLMS